MVNTFTLALIRLVQRLSIVVTLACLAYVFFFLVFKSHENLAVVSNDVKIEKGVGLIAPVSVFDVHPLGESVGTQARDIFSLSTSANSSSVVENTPKGQLPDHLKVVGILLGKSSQIIIEDTQLNKTYFIDEGSPQAGISIVRADKDQMVINYQGQDINVPVSKN